MKVKFLSKLLFMSLSTEVLTYELNIFYKKVKILNFWARQQISRSIGMQHVFGYDADLLQVRIHVASYITMQEKHAFLTVFNAANYF